MDRRRIDRPSGVVTLMVTGPGGAVTLDAWWYQGKRGGCITLHRTPAGQEGQPHECDYHEGGCFPDYSFLAGQNLAPLVSTDLEELAWHEVEEWYRTRIEGDS